MEKRERGDKMRGGRREKKRRWGEREMVEDRRWVERSGEEEERIKEN